ncbi:MAG: hypothetical protein HKP14_09135 [Bacteroidia bacterium]|nr:hypothetical protein [Bacteroidia bacterium]
MAYSDNLDHLPQNALQLILQSGKFGIRGAKRLFSIGFLFGFCNLLLITYGFYNYFGKHSESINGLYLMLLFAVGILFTGFALYRAYQFVLVEIFGYAYQQSSGLFHRLSEVIIDNSEKVVNQSNDSQFSKAFDYASVLKEKFDRAPRFVSKAVSFLLNKIPLAGMVKNVQSELAEGNKEEASSHLYNEMDTFITQNIFGSNNTKWVYWLLPLNIAVMLAIVFLKLS